jgi:hypothetical protein
LISNPSIVAEPSRFSKCKLCSILAYFILFFTSILFFNARSCNNLQPFFIIKSIYKTFIPLLYKPLNSLLDFIKDTTHPHTKSVVQLMMRRRWGGALESVWVWDMIYSPSFEDNKMPTKVNCFVLL